MPTQALVPPQSASIPFQYQTWSDRHMKLVSTCLTAVEGKLLLDHRHMHWHRSSLEHQGCRDPMQ